MKMLLTGASGLLGSAIVKVAQRQGIICVPLARPVLPWNPETIARWSESLQGYDLVIHAAANTNVEQCELAPDECYRDNFLLTELILKAAANAHARVVFVSSTGIYGAGLNAAYREYDTVQPSTHHHRSKYLAEQAVLAADPRHLVVRTGWLFGGPASNPKNFVARRIDEARAAVCKGFIESNTEQRGVPCFNEDVAVRILALVDAEMCGIFNCVNSDSASRYEYVSAIVELAGLPIEVRPSGAAVFNRKAKVSNNEMAENWKMSSLGWPAMPGWRTSLAGYIRAELVVPNGETA